MVRVNLEREIIKEPSEELGTWNVLEVGGQRVYTHSGDFYPLDISEFHKALKSTSNPREFPLLYLSIYPSDICNHKCRWCYEIDNDDSRKKEMLSKIAVDNIVDSSESIGLKLVRLVGGGEPLLNPYTPYLIQRLSEKGVCTNLITNGELLDINNSKMGNVAQTIVKYASQLRVSLDAACQKTFNEEHRPPSKKSFYKILRSIEKIANLKEALGSDITITTTFLVNKNNYTEVVDFVSLCSVIGVNMIWFKSLANYDNFSADEIYELNSMIDEVRWNHKGVIVNASRFDTKTIKKQASFQSKKPTEYCFVSQLKSYISANGSVANCISYQDNLNFVYGNINQSSLEKIWRSDKRIELIEQRKNKPHNNCVKFCLEKSFNNGVAILYTHPKEHTAIKHRLGFEELREVLYGRIK